MLGRFGYLALADGGRNLRQRASCEANSSVRVGMCWRDGCHDANSPLHLILKFSWVVHVVTVIVVGVHEGINESHDHNPTCRLACRTSVMRSYKIYGFHEGGSRRSSKSSRKCWKRHGTCYYGRGSLASHSARVFFIFQREIVSLRTCRCTKHEGSQPPAELLRAGESGEVSSAVNLAHILVRFYSAKSQ